MKIKYSVICMKLNKNNNFVISFDIITKKIKLKKHKK